MFMACDHIDFKIYIQLYKYTMTYNHDNHCCVFGKVNLQVWHVII